MTGYIEKRNGSFSLFLFEKKNGEFVFKGEREFPEDDASVREQVNGLDRIYLNIPPRSLHFRILKLPFNEREKVNDVIPFQLEGMTVEHVENIVYDFRIIDKIEDEYLIAVVFTYRDILKDILRELSFYSIRPEVITSVECSPALMKGSLEELAEGVGAFTEEEKLGWMARLLVDEPVNLAQGEFGYRKDRETAKRYSRISAILLLIMAVFFSVHLLMGIRNYSRSEKDLKQEMVRIYSQLIPEDKKIIDPLYQLKSHIKQIGWKESEFNDAKPLDILDDVTRSWPKGESAEGIKITPDFITLSGEVGNAEDVKAIADSLPFADARPVIETKQTAGGKTGYSLQLKLVKGK